MRMLMVVVLSVLVCLPLAAEEIWTELVPDNAAVSLQLTLNEANQPTAAIKAMGCWNLLDIGQRTLQGDLWGVNPVAGGLSYPIFGTVELPRFLGIGYDGTLGGDAWYNRLVIYGKTTVEVEF